MSVIFNVKGIGGLPIYQKAPKKLKDYARSKGLGIKKLTYRFQGLNPKTGYALTREGYSREWLMEMVTIEPDSSGTYKWFVTINDSYASSFFAKNMSEVVTQLKQFTTNFNFDPHKLVKR